MPTYQVLDWDKHFENHKSRTITTCSWVYVPNKQSGLGLRRILSLPDGAAIYGVWNLIVGKLSHHRPPRAGWMTHEGRSDGTPWALEDMQIMWGLPIPFLERVMQVLTSKEVGWIVPTWCPESALEAPLKRPDGAQGRMVGVSEGQQQRSACQTPNGQGGDTGGEIAAAEFE